jgi:CheY-like chemotaxis protein
MAEPARERELWVMGLGNRVDRGAVVCSYLAEAGYWARTASQEELAESRPLGIVLDLSPHSVDGWGILLTLKADPATRNIPILPVFLSEKGKVAGVFPVSGFFVLPVDQDHLVERLAVLGLTEDVQDYDLQAMIVTKKGEEKVAKLLTSLGFDVVNGYTGREAVALATIGRPYLIFCSLTLPDMGAFELMDRFLLYPQTSKIPFFIFIKDAMKDGEKIAMSREIQSLVRKKELSRDEFLAHLRRRG